MFHIDSPQVIEFLRHNKLVDHCDRDAEDSEDYHNPNDSSKVSIISIFGSGSNQPSKSGFKRAFRLAIDCFGHVNLFSENTAEKTSESEDKNGQEKISKTNKDLEGEGTKLEQEGDSLAEEEQKEGDSLGKQEEIDSLGKQEEISPHDDDQQDSEVVSENIAVEESEDKVPEDVEAQSTKESTHVAASDECSVPVEDQGGNSSTLRKHVVAEIDSCYLDGFYSKTDSILFLHLNGAYDPAQLVISAEKLHQSIEETGFIPVWSSLKSLHCRYLLLMFSLSHIMLLSHPGSKFDTSYLHLFRVLDAVRLAIKSAISRALEKVGILPKDWVLQGRICSPRMLFLFELESTDSSVTFKNFHTASSADKQHQLEDEIYQILRKCRVITNISANSLCTIPSEDEYVFLFEKDAENAVFMDLPDTEMYLEIIRQSCISSKNNKSTIPSAYRTTGTEFILLHTTTALAEGFDDDSKRVADYKHFFVVPTFGEWKVGFKIVYDCFFGTGTKSRSLTEGLDQLMKYVNVDSEYLHSQCSNVFPKIYAVYQRGLPEYYSYNTHRIRLTHAMNAYLTISRGPGVVPWLNKLAEKCDKYWKRGRQQCEIVSLFNHSCINPLHKVAPEDSLEIFPVPEMDSKLSEMKHSAGSRLISYCNCGRKQGIRDEPFTIREANCAFYQRIAQECCERDRLDKVEFPIFVPNTETELSLEEMLNILKIKSGDLSDVKDVRDHSNSASQIMEVDLRQENILRDDASDASESQEVLEELIEEINENIENLDEKCESATLDVVPDVVESGTGMNEKLAADEQEAENKLSEYLPGMLHSKSPKDLLPKFSSWSLVRLGMSSLYNHSSGISPRSGFLNGTNFLLPWDVMVKAEKGVSKPIPRMIRGRKPSSRSKPISDEFSVKIFFGLEYECHRGHRLLANDYEKVVNFNTGNSGLREAGAKIATSDMPLYFKCPCKESRDGRTMIAQMMRIHIVTPKAPVHCMISPRVQPAPSPCPSFSPENTEPIKLTPSSYWVLRLPYCYVGDHIYVPPLEPDSVRSGKIFQGMVTVKSMTPAETKAWEKANL